MANATARVEDDFTVEHDKGYDSLARLMRDYPETTIFRQFKALCAKMLVYRQADLLYDEEELELVSRWNEDDPEKKWFNHSWKEILDNPDAAVLRDKVNHVQEKLKSYCKDEMLVLTAEVEKLPGPNSLSFTFLQEWVKHRDRGADFLLDIEAQAWDSCQRDDYVVLSPTTSHDRLAIALDALIVPLYHRYIGTRRPPTAHKTHGRVWDYRFDRFILLGNILTILLATAIPAGSIVVLYVIKSMIIRLLIIAIFCLVFACTMTFMVGAKRVNVFSATAAFAAVQAVFVGGTTLVQMG
ncbi:uncharacterized protein Z518_11147 [Rhinocladiella mackenziei CBS 650.93]|uniref:Rhinocladiella mackenziei CBS 650.93 unplaced genomic scaffold supercont1.11, whole genome shotgun sequence n=1 Tax=Rhinocladiella mackenziei CBS 650.93 TaxID=1442369 RepID=A0A0D2ISI9_9EURO|nr:uncharacterized protein Z518_11147 [Rhinocladiella mackenziei CBS 650.93]KIW99734.1 hypothetical protein Z518_11147 [Rhinocladiella mackenziei CBS 650.93]